MSDINETLAALETAALEATPGPWNYGGSSCDDNETALAICKKHISATAVPNENGLFCEVWDDDYRRTALVGHGPNGQANARYIALANPATILALIEHVRRQDAELDRMTSLDHESKRAIDKHRQEIAEECARLRVENTRLREQIAEAERQEPVAWGMPNTAITGKRHALMMVELDVPSNDQYGGALWVPLYARPLPAPVSVPAGWKLVPVEPTPEMLFAADEADREYTDRHFGPGHALVQQGAYDHWHAMLAAAPSPTEKES